MVLFYFFLSLSHRDVKDDNYYILQVVPMSHAIESFLNSNFSFNTF